MAKYFIDRPIFAIVISLFLMLAGGLTLIGLPPQRLINNWTGVRIGLVESLMPYAVLVLIAVGPWMIERMTYFAVEAIRTIPSIG